MPTSVLNHIFALSRNFCLIAIITGCSFYLLWSHNADTNPFECLTQKGMKKAYNGGFFFACFLRNAEACIIGERSGRSGRARQRVRYRTARTAATSCLVGSLVIPDFCLNLITFIYTHILLIMQTFSLSCFSSSHRGGGVAPDCMDFALKASFP